MTDLRTWQVFAAWVLAGSASAAFAQEAPRVFHVFGGAGMAHSQADCDAVTQCARSGSAAQAGVGLQLPLSVAGGSLALEARAMQFDGAALANAALRARFRQDMMALGLAWRRPVYGGLGLYVGGGAAQVTTRVALVPTGAGQATNGRDAEWTGYAALGLQHALGSAASFDVQLFVTRSRYDQGGLDLGAGHLAGLMAGFTQRF